MGARKPRAVSAGKSGRSAGPPSAADTKRGRREEGRRRREKIRHRAARRAKLRKVGIGLVIAAIVATVGAIVVRDQVLASHERQTQQALLAQASKAAQAAGCTGVRDVRPYSPSSEDQQHVTSLPPLDSYASSPPASGPHFPIPLAAGVYSASPTLGEAIHSLEHGAVEVWLAPSASGPEVSRIESALGHEDHVIVAPYSYPGSGGQLPSGRQMVLVAWHHVQDCDQVSAPVAAAFVAGYDASISKHYLGDAPEAGASI